MFIPRRITDHLLDLSETRLGRCLVLTGARQTGKTTLMKREFVPRGYEYHSFDEPLGREALLRRSAADWLRRGRRYVFDEVQKAPPFLGTVKAMLDEGPSDLRIVLTGSAQIALLSGVRESLAGRSVTRELFPLMAGELAGAGRTALEALLTDCAGSADVRALFDEAAFGGEAADRRARTRESVDRILAFGAMPAVLPLDSEAHRFVWLEEYCRTYLQRDVADLGRVSDLDDFLRLQRIVAARTGGIVNYADLARDADLAPITAKKYLRYLELSYQAFLLEAYRGRLDSRLLKAQRLHLMDLGVQRVLSGLRSGLTGPQFETAVAAEVTKVVRTLRLDVWLGHFRTKDGREVDVLLRTPAGGYVAIEVKAARRVARQDARHLAGIEMHLGGPLLAGLVVYRGDDLHFWDDGRVGLPVDLLLGGTGSSPPASARTPHGDSPAR